MREAVMFPFFVSSGMLFDLTLVLKLRLLILYLFIHYSVPGQLRYYKNYPAFTTDTYPVTEKTPDGGFIVCGAQYYVSAANTWIIKFDKCGMLEWTKTIQNFSCSDMILTKDTNLILLSLNNQLVKMDLSGNVIWGKIYHNGGVAYYGYSVGEFPNGDLFINGNVSMQTNAASRSFIIKMDASGNIKWDYYYGSFSSWGMATACSDGGVLSRAYFLSFKTDSTGNLQWSKELPPTGSSFEPLEVNDGFVFARYGNTASSDTCFLYKTDKQGNLLWTSERFKMNFATRLRKLANGNFACLGSLKIDLSTYRFNPSVAELSPAGNFISQKSYRPSAPSGNSFHGDGFCFLDDSCIVIAGRERYIWQSSYSSVLNVLKTGRNGTLGCNDSIITEFYPSKPITAVNKTLTALPTYFYVAPYNVMFLNNTFEEQTYCAGFDSIKFKFPESMCVSAGGTLYLQAPPGYQYLWSTQDTTPGIMVNSPGLYSVQLKHPCHNFTTVTATVMVHYCLTVGSGEKAISKAVQVFPNPSKGLLFINDFNGTAELYNITGEKMLETKVSGKVILNLENFGKGLFALRLHSNRQTINRKIIIE
jgi:hypothetical protein